MLKDLISGLLMAASILAAAPAFAQDYPTRTVKIIVPFGAGGITDLYARMVADRLKVAFNQPVVVENRPGQGGSFGPASVAKSDPDGYTLLLGGSGNAIGESLYKNLSYSLLKDFVPVARGAWAVNLLFVNPKVKANTTAELIALAKSQPGKLTYASSGHGGIYHLAMEMFRHMSGTDILHVPYRTETAGRTDVVSGQVDMMISAYGITAPGIEAGQLRPIALTSKARFSGAPNIPTLAESGLPGYEGDAWVGLLAPTGTPAAVISRINAEVAKMHEDPEFRAKLAQAGMSPAGLTVEEFGAFLKADVARWKKVIEVSGTKIEQ